MRLLAILGSPRSGGNTDTLALEIVRGAEEKGIETQTAALRELTIRPCSACEKCWHRSRPCVFEDDMSRLYDAIAQSDILLLATPVYWYAPTAIMKAFIDRLVPFNRPQGRHLIEGKGAVAAIAYEEVGPTAAEPLLKMLDLSFDYLGVRLIDSLVVDGVGPKGAVMKRPDVLKRARNVGCSLADWRKT